MRQPQRQSETPRHLVAQDGEFRVGLAGPETDSESGDDDGFDPLFAAVLRVMDLSEREALLPRMHLAACSGRVPGTHFQNLVDRGVPLFAAVSDMVAEHPEMNLVIELTGCPKTMSQLRRKLLPSVALMDRACTIFLRYLLEMIEVSGRYQTDLQGSRNLLTTIVDELPEDIFFLDEQGRILDVNRQVCERHGMDKQAILHQTSNAIPAGPGQVPCGPAPTQWPVVRTLALRKEAEALQTWMDEEGRVHYYQVTSYPVFDTEGRIQRMIEVRRDVTLRTEMEKRLQQAEKLAAIGELSTYIAHEIRNPLFAIGGFANSLLRSKELSESSQDKVRIILEESKRLDRILKNILNFARPTSSKLTEVDVNQVVSQTMQVLGMGCEERGVALDIRLGDEVPKARADHELLKQCLINLVKNALEAMPDGGHLTVTTAMEGQQVLISVGDTGQGIAPELQDKIFNPFFTTKHKRGGTGLGLAMTKKIIGDLGGELRLVSLPGSGTRSTLYLRPYAAMDETTSARSDG